MISLPSLKSNTVIASAAWQSSSLKTQSNSGLLRRDYVTSRNDVQLSLRGAKHSLPRAKRGGGNPLLNFIIILFLSTAPCLAAIEFDGVNDYIRIPSSSNFNYGTGDFTWTAWIYPTRINDSYEMIWAQGTSGIPYLAIRDDRLHFYLSSVYETSTSYVQANTWQHVGIRRTAGVLQLFKDGVNYGPTSNQAGSIAAGIASISRYGDSTGHFFDGFMDDIRVYKRALTDSEIEALHKAKRKHVSGSVANGLIAHYEMDDDAIGEIAAQAKDSSGNLRHGEFIGFNNLVSNGFSADVPTQIGTGTSLKFDGINDHIAFGDTLDMGTSDYTTSLWFRTNDTNGSLISKSFYGGVANRWGIVIESGFINALFDATGSPVVTNTTSSQYLDNNWHYVTVSYVRNGNMNLYIDGELKSFASIASHSGANIQSTFNLLLGHYNNATDGTGAHNSVLKFSGELDNVQIYNRALTPSEISFLYNGSGLNPGTSNLQALWTFDDDSAVKDSSGYDNHGLGRGGASLKYIDGVLKR